MASADTSSEIQRLYDIAASLDGDIDKIAADSAKVCLEMKKRVMERIVFK